MADRSIIFRFSASGQADVIRVFDSVLERVRRFSVEEQALARTSLAATVSSAKAKAEAKIRFEEQAFKHAAAQDRQKLRLEADVARQAVRLADDRARMGLRLHEAAEKAKTRATEQEAKRRHDVEMQQLRRTTSEQVAVQRSAIRQAERDARQFARDRAFEERRLLKGIASGVGDAAFGGIRATGRLMRTGAHSIASGMGLDRSFDVQDIVRERMQVGMLLSRVAVEAREAGSPFGGFDKIAAQKKIASVAFSTGFSQGELAKAIDVYSEKGSGATAVANLERIGKQAQAMGTDPGTVAMLRAQLGISSAQQGKELNEDEKDQILSMMHLAGKTGVWRAESMATEAPALFSRWAASGQDFHGGMRKFIQFANVVRTGTGSAAEARTAMRSMQDVIGRDKGNIFEKMGIRTRDAEGHQLDVLEVAMQAIEKTGGWGAKWSKLFPDIRAQKAMTPLVTAFQGAGGGAAGRAAMEKMLTGSESLDKASVAEMEKDFAEIMEDPAMKMAKATEEIRQALSEQLLPILKAFSEGLKDLLPTITKAIQWAGKNPGAALAAYTGVMGFGSAAPHLAGAALRFGAGKLVNTVPGLAGGAGSLLGAGGAGLGGGAGSIGAGAGGGTAAAAGGGMLGGSAAGLAGLGALVVGASMAANALFDLYRSTDTFKKGIESAADASLAAKNDFAQAQAGKLTADNVVEALDEIDVGATGTRGITGTGKARRSESTQVRGGFKDIEKRRWAGEDTIAEALAEAAGQTRSGRMGSTIANPLAEATGISMTGKAKLVGGGALADLTAAGAGSTGGGREADAAAAQLALTAKAAKEAQDSLEGLARGAKAAGDGVSALKMPIRSGR